MTTETTQDDDFTAAFAQFGKDEPVAETTPAPAEPESTDADAPPAADATPVDEGEAEAEAPEVPEASTSPTDDELLARLVALAKQAPETPKEPEAPAPAAEPDIYTAEEKTFLSEYEKDWPDVAKAEALRRRSEYRDLVNHVFSEVAKELGPIAETMRTLAERAHLTDLHEKVEDYDTVRENVIEWVNNQPAYLQNAYKEVIQHGTPDEVADLVSRYKKEATPATPPAKSSKAETELPASTKQAVAALAPVSSKRSTIVQADDPNDFEGAFEAFAKQA
jgi:dihydroneopterin aldolase